MNNPTSNPARVTFEPLTRHELVRGSAAKPIVIDLDFEDAVKALLGVDPGDLPDKAKSPSQPDRSQSAPGS